MRSSLKSQASSELEKMKKGDYDDLMQKQAAGKHEVDEIMNQAASQNNDGLFAQAQVASDIDNILDIQKKIVQVKQNLSEEDPAAKQNKLDNAGLTSRERDMLGPSPKKNPNRTYPADAPVNALNQKQGPSEDAYSGQKKHDDENLTLKEKGHQQTKTVPVVEAINPKRGYSAGEPSNALALNQKKGPAEDAYKGQKNHDDENLTIKEKGY